MDFGYYFEKDKEYGLMSHIPVRGKTGLILIERLTILYQEKFVENLPKFDPKSLNLKYYSDYISF